MTIAPKVPSAKRRSVNLTIREEVIEAAKAHGLNTSQAADAGIVQAIKNMKAAQRLKDNQAAIGAHHARIEKEGSLLTPDRAAESRHGPIEGQILRTE